VEVMVAVDGGEVMVVVGGEVAAVAAVDGVEMAAGGVMAEVGPLNFLGISKFASTLTITLNSNL